MPVSRGDVGASSDSRPSTLPNTPQRSEHSPSTRLTPQNSRAILASEGRGTGEPKPLRVRSLSGWGGRAACPARLRVQAWHSSGAVAVSVYPPSGCGGKPRIAFADPVAEQQATGSGVNGLGSGRLRPLRKDRGVPFWSSLTVASDPSAHESGHRLTFRLREAAGQTSHGASRPYRRNRK